MTTPSDAALSPDETLHFDGCTLPGDHEGPCDVPVDGRLDHRGGCDEWTYVDYGGCSGCRPYEERGDELARAIAENRSLSFEEAAAVVARTAGAKRETLAFEVVVRFYPGSEREARDFAANLELPEQAAWLRLDRIVVPAGEDRVRELSRGRSGGPGDDDPNG